MKLTTTEDQYFVESGPDGAFSEVVAASKLHQSVHDAMCMCGESWESCGSAWIQQTARLLDDAEEWTAALDFPRWCWQQDFEDGYIRVALLTRHVPPASAQMPVDRFMPACGVDSTMRVVPHMVDIEDGLWVRHDAFVSLEYQLASSIALAKRYDWERKRFWKDRGDAYEELAGVEKLAEQYKGERDAALSEVERLKGGSKVNESRAETPAPEEDDDHSLFSIALCKDGADEQYISTLGVPPTAEALAEQYKAERDAAIALAKSQRHDIERLEEKCSELTNDGLRLLKDVGLSLKFAEQYKGERDAALAEAERLKAADGE